MGMRITEPASGDDSAMALRNDPDDEPRRSMRDRRPVMKRLLPFLVVGAAAIGFGAIVGYGYWAFSDGQGRIAVPLVTAGQPYLEKPANPGGIETPNANLSIWTVGKGAPAPQKPESFVPPPEAPLPRPAPAAPPQVAAAPATAAPQPAAPQPAAAPQVQAAAPQVPPAQDAAARTEGRLAPGSFPMPAPPAPPVRQVAVVPGAAAALPPPPAAGGFKVQVGAVRSEDEARKLWEQVRRKHPGELGRLSPSVSRVAFPDGKTFYRVQAGTLPDRDAARETCSRLERAGSVCIVVAPN